MRLLDIGCGEGHALLPALTAEMKTVAEVDAVEPSRQRLAVVTAELGRRGIKYRAHPCTVQEFTTRAGAGRWDLVQETFALLTLSSADRMDLFTWLRPRTARLALIEFDVPELGHGLEPARFRYLIEAYERGLREYDSDRELVAQGILVPVLLGTLSETDQAHSEQPIERWVLDLKAAHSSRSNHHRKRWLSTWVVGFLA
jgi:SAM-dependent methyltransferase